MATLSVRFTDEEHAELRMAAAKLHVAGVLPKATISELVKTALSEYMAKNGNSINP